MFSMCYLEMNYNKIYKTMCAYRSHVQQLNSVHKCKVQLCKGASQWQQLGKMHSRSCMLSSGPRHTVILQNTMNCGLLNPIILKQYSYPTMNQQKQSCSLNDPKVKLKIYMVYCGQFVQTIYSTCVWILQHTYIRWTMYMYLLTFTSFCPLQCIMYHFQLN